jgi:hypothetical protein
VEWFSYSLALIGLAGLILLIRRPVMQFSGAASAGTIAAEPGEWDDDWDEDDFDDEYEDYDDDDESDGEPDADVGPNGAHPNGADSQEAALAAATAGGEDADGGGDGEDGVVEGRAGRGDGEDGEVEAGAEGGDGGADDGADAVEPLAETEAHPAATVEAEAEAEPAAGTETDGESAAGGGAAGGSSAAERTDSDP